MTVADLHALFLNPPNTYRGKPFWSWNGTLDRSELIRQVHVLHRMGMGGFFMHSRTGLATPYLGDEWFDLINACSDEAERLGMEAWLYDEDRWPSGTAGGKVTEDPEFRRRYLRMSEHSPTDDVWDDSVVAAFACRRDGLAVSEVRRLSRGETPGSRTDGQTVIAFRVVEMAPSSFYNGFTYVDTMDPRATRRFIELTHEQYARRCGERLGGAIKGIFTDEPHRGALMDPFGGEGDDSVHQAPWNDTVPIRFREAFGYDLLDRLPELFLQLDGEPVSQVKWHFVELLMRMFLDGFAEPYAQWCREHGILVTGHVLHEDSLAAQTAMCGSVMRYYEHMDIPGIDLLIESNRSYWVARQLQSVARQIGRRFLLSELYGCTGWQMPYKGHKAVGDWQALFGINVRCHHLAWYTMEGEAKRDFPASIFHQSAWWRTYRHVEDYFSRIGAILDRGERVCDILVIHPVESAWCRVHPGWSRYLGAGPDLQAVERQFAEMFHWLQGAQLDFDYGDEEMLARLGQVADCGRLKLGEATYKTVVVGGLTTIRSTTLDLLRRFVEAGGKVILAGDPPSHVDALPSPGFGISDIGFQRAAWSRDALVAACEAAADRTIVVRDPASGSPVASVFAQVRRDTEGRTFAFVLNTDRDAPVAMAELRLAGLGPIEEWDCVTGERLAVAWGQEGGEVVMPLSLPAAGGRLLVAGPDVPERPAPVAVPSSSSVRLPGPFAYRLSEPNVCVLDLCRWRISGGEWSERMEVLKADQAVRAALGLAPRGGEMLQPWFTAQNGHRTLAEVEVSFAFEAVTAPAGPVDLAMERRDLVSACVNGARLQWPADAEPWVDRCFSRVPIPSGWIREGVNEITVRWRYHEGIGLEAIYVLGDFGVRLDGSFARLTDLPDAIVPGDVCDQGLPFYGGAIALRMVAPTAREADSRIIVGTPGLGAACALALAADSPLPSTSSLALEDEPEPDGRLIAWDPYEADITDLIGADGSFDLHVYLTRRNTFGPLHQWPREWPGYGPGNWVTEGEAFREAHVLWPAGLVEPPIVSVRPAQPRTNE